MYKLIDGKSISTEIINELKTKIGRLKVSGKKIVLADILVGDDPASLVYANSKSKKFNEDISNWITKDVTDDNVLYDQLLCGTGIYDTLTAAFRRDWDQLLPVSSGG